MNTNTRQRGNRQRGNTNALCMLWFSTKTKKRKTKNTKHILQLYCGSIKKVGDKTNL